MKVVGTDGLMLARNQIRRLLKQNGEPDSLACELTRQITCCAEGLHVLQLFPDEEAEQLTTHCELYCTIEPQPNS